MGSIAKELPTIKLIYRGNTFDYAPPAEVEPENMDDWLTVILTYRGNIPKKSNPSKPTKNPKPSTGVGSILNKP